jgi:hypothetical protein
MDVAAWDGCKKFISAWWTERAAQQSLDASSCARTGDRRLRQTLQEIGPLSLPAPAVCALGHQKGQQHDTLCWPEVRTLRSGARRPIRKRETVMDVDRWTRPDASIASITCCLNEPRPPLFNALPRSEMHIDQPFIANVQGCKCTVPCSVALGQPLAYCFALSSSLLSSA